MNRTALITIKTSRDGKRCLNSCPGLNEFGDVCSMFGGDALECVVVGNTDDRFDAVRCRACIAATSRFDKLTEDHRKRIAYSNPQTRDWNS